MTRLPWLVKCVYPYRVRDVYSVVARTHRQQPNSSSSRWQAATARYAQDHESSQGAEVAAPGRARSGTPAGAQIAVAGP